jgi:hypothetical protein
MSFQEITKGFRTDPEGGAAAPPFTQPRYKFNSDISFMGNFRKMPHRYYLEEFFKQIPDANASIDVSTNLDFEILGTNASVSDLSFDTTTGGIKIATAGADNDQMIILPHLDTKQTAWTGVKWGTENQVIWECMISTGDDIATGVLYWAGLKLTNTPTVATDADQAFFRFSTDDSDTNWEIVYSIDGTDTTVDSGVVVEADTQYRFRIEIDSDRKAHFFINDTLVANSTALKNDVDLIPYVGIQALSAAAEFMKLHYEKINRVIFE